MQSRLRCYLVPTAFLAVACAATPFINDYVRYVATLAAIWAVLAVSFDVLLGYTGYLSLAHGALFGVGAYTGGLLTARAGWSFWLALPVCGLVAMAVGIVVALLAFRTKGLYFAVLTLGIGLIGFQMFFVAEDWTGGVVGFVGIPSPPPLPFMSLDAAGNNLVIALLLLWVTYLAAGVFVRSPMGAASLAIREDVVLAQALGIRISAARLTAFAFSAFFAGTAGMLFGAISNFVAPESFAVMTTGFQMVVLVVVGGMGTLWGPILGAILLTTLPETLRVASSYSLLAYGVLLLVFMLFAPKGIAGLLKQAWHARRARQAAVAAPAAQPVTEGVR